tara:strand:- start:315 stop:518 length:204 start_codon:yes stop_codon:yes gene_type:complete
MSRVSNDKWAVPALIEAAKRIKDYVAVKVIEPALPWFLLHEERIFTMLGHRPYTQCHVGCGRNVGIV